MIIPNAYGYHYVLDENGQPRDEPDIIKWGEWFQNADRRVASDEIGSVRVSTVFLGMNHNFTFSGDPVLWETMIFGGDGELADYQERYTSREAALAGHKIAVELVRGGVT